MLIHELQDRYECKNFQRKDLVNQIGFLAREYYEIM